MHYYKKELLMKLLMFIEVYQYKVHEVLPFVTASGFDRSKWCRNNESLVFFFFIMINQVLWVDAVILI